MTSTLEDIIKDKIRENGPMSVASYMSLALGHPEHGYYMKQDPFGRQGDFVTAPDVSQLFGEMIGVWVADIWVQMGRPSRFVLLECGPGRGTLMADILRATYKVEGFHAALELHLLEISPVLKAKQGEVLSEYTPQWHEELESVPGDCPVIVVGNEFLDALPFEQFIQTANGPVERMVVLDDKGLSFTHHSSERILEVAPARNQFVRHVCARLQKQCGAALFVDYGHVKSASGDTFQAVKSHKSVDVLSHIGDADLTSHVDFQALSKDIAVGVAGPVTQGDFLRALGIEMRAAMLKNNASAEQIQVLEKGLHRLIDSDQMGELFKVIGFYHSHDTDITPAGFF